MPTSKWNTLALYVSIQHADWRFIVLSALSIVGQAFANALNLIAFMAACCLVNLHNPAMLDERLIRFFASVLKDLGSPSNYALFVAAVCSMNLMAPMLRGNDDPYPGGDGNSRGDSVHDGRADGVEA